MGKSSHIPERKVNVKLSYRKKHVDFNLQGKQKASIFYFGYFQILPVVKVTLPFLLSATT